MIPLLLDEINCDFCVISLLLNETSSQGDKMKRRLVGFVGLFVLAMLSAAVTFGQNQTLRSVAGDKWVISAKAGGVNFVQGGVSVARKEGKSGLLLKGDNVVVGDRVTTDVGGRAEILLNPGSYLRVSENSVFSFATTSLEDLQIKIERGSVILEVFADKDFRVAVNSPKEEYGLIQTGVYRIDVAADGSGRLEVWKGKAEVGDSVLKGGKAAVSNEGQVAVAKFDRDDRDDFEIWSRTRAKELAKETNSLRDRELRTSLMRSFLGGRWNMYNSFGLWVYSARLGRHCFLPFGYGWSSPYGFGYGTDIWWYRLPSAVYLPPVTPPSSGRGPGSGAEFPGDRRPRQPAQKAPPFAEMQGGSSTGPKFGRGVQPVGDDGGFGRRPSPSANPSFSTPMKQDPVSSPPPSSGPVRRSGGKGTIN